MVLHVVLPPRAPEARLRHRPRMHRIVRELIEEPQRHVSPRARRAQLPAKQRNEEEDGSRDERPRNFGAVDGDVMVWLRVVVFVYALTQPLHGTVKEVRVYEPLLRNPRSGAGGECCTARDAPVRRRSCARLLQRATCCRGCAVVIL